MSISIGYFFNSDVTLPEVAKMIDQALGCHFEPYQSDGADLFCRLLSLETSLGVHELENDRDLDFSTYRFELDTRTPECDANLRELQLGLMTMIPSVLQIRASITKGILVYDLQKLLARYEMRNDRFFDSVGGRPIAFPEHFRHVCERAWAA